METQSPRLKDLLPERLDGLSGRVRGHLSESDQAECAKVAWNSVGPQLKAALEQALDCDLMPVIAKAWKSSQLLAQYGDPEKHPPGERSVVELCGHELTRELKPVLTVTVGPCPPIELQLTLAVSASFDGVRLVIVDGHIIGGDLGTATASAQLSLNGQPLHDPAESRPAPLPGRFAFDPPGIALRWTGPQAGSAIDAVA